MIYQIKKNWFWSEANLIIKRFSKESSQQFYFQSFCPQLAFYDKQNQQFSFNASIQMQQELLFDEQLGFYWHKSKNLPLILVKLGYFQQLIVKQLSLTNQIEVQILSGYPCKENQSIYLQEVRLIGKTILQIKNLAEVTKIQNIKFDETSFFHNRNKFSLIISFSVQNKETNSKCILSSFISPSITIDSRKNAIQKRPTLKFLLQPISKDQFDQPICQVYEKKCCETIKKEDKLSNITKDSFQLFLDFFTSSSIRKKKKHPFYIGYQFTNTFSVFLNSELYLDPIEALRMINYERGVFSKKILLFFIRKQGLSQLNDTKASSISQDCIIKVEQSQVDYFQLNQKLTFQQKSYILSNKSKAKMKLNQIFQYWNFHFIQVSSQQELTEKQLSKKWVLLKRQQLFEAYFKYIDQFQIFKTQRLEYQQKKKDKGDCFHKKMIDLTKKSS